MSQFRHKAERLITAGAGRERMVFFRVRNRKKRTSNQSDMDGGRRKWWGAEEHPTLRLLMKRSCVIDLSLDNLSALLSWKTDLGLFYVDN